jgi:pimeloyl-ACP methyl ester carboxylesterase/DNA-binding CsgD family transcriptional regulator
MMDDDRTLAASGVVEIQPVWSAPAPVQDVEAILRQGVAAGRPSLAFLDAWRSIGALADESEASLIDILDAAARLDPSIAAAATASVEGLGFAVVGRGARPRRIDDRFQAWIGNPAESLGCSDLTRRAYLEDSVVGLVETLSHGVLPVLAKRIAGANQWPLALEAPGGVLDRDAVVLVAFAPSRSQALVLRAATALGLSPLESRLAAALMTAPSLEAAARVVGVGRETAKDALAAAMRKTGTQGSSQLLGRIIDLSCGAEDRPVLDRDLPARALGLTPLETQVARLIADGDTAEEAALALGLTPATIKSYRRAIFAKTGINRSRDLRRLMTELAELHRFDRAFEVTSEEVGGGALVVAIDAEGRRVAALDYGPASGRPLLLFHGYSTGRLAPPIFRERLEQAGFRVIIPQRPGFGLTAPARGDYLDAAARDVGLILDRLGCARATVVARDGAVATALALAHRFPDRVERGLLINPRQPRDASRRRATPLGAIAVMLLSHPRLIDTFGAMMMRQSSREMLIGMFRGVFAAAAADKDCFERPGMADHLIADQRGLVGRAGRGFVAELRLFSDGWRPPADYAGPKWRLAFSGALDPHPNLQAWESISHGAAAVIPDAGMLVQFTHPDALVTLLS